MIRNVGYGFRDSGKNGRGVFPTHGKDKGNGDEFGMMPGSREDHGEFGGVTRCEAHSVESVGQINFEHVDGPPSWVGQQQRT